MNAIWLSKTSVKVLSFILAVGMILFGSASGLAGINVAQASPGGSWTLDYTNLFTNIDGILKDQENVVPAVFSGWKMTGFTIYSDYTGQRLSNVTGNGSIEVDAPEGEYYFGVVIIAARGTQPSLSFKLNGETKGAFSVPYQDNRYYLYFTDNPVEFAEGDKMTVDANGTQARVAGFVFAKNRPNAVKINYAINDAAAAYQPGAPYRTDGKTAIRFTWTTTWASTGEIEISGGDLSQPVTLASGITGRLHRIDWEGFTPGETYTWVIKATDADGTTITSALNTANAYLPAESATASGTQTVALPVTNDSAGALANWPVDTGVPFAQGVLGSADDVRVMDGGTEILAQTTVLSRWSDNSVKWLRVEFLTDLAGKETKTYALQYGSQVAKTQTGDSLVGQSGGVYTIDTGFLKVQIDSGDVSIPGDIWYDESGSGNYLGAPMTEDGVASVVAGGTTYTSMGAAEEVRIESDGPVRATIYVKGHHTNGNSEMFLYEVRIHAYKDSPLLWLEYTFGNDKTSKFTTVSSLSLDIPMAADTAKIGGENGSVIDVESLTTPALLSQMTDNAYTVTGAATASGNRAEGWVELTDSASTVTTIATRYFWQNYPKKLEVASDKLSVDLMPPFLTSDYDNETQIEKDKLYFHMQEDGYKLYTGMSARHDFLFAFGQEAAGVPTQYVNSALKANLDRDAYVQSEVFGAMSEEPGYFSQLLASQSKKHISTYQGVLDSQRTYGMINFGDWWGERGYNWGNLEYDTVQSLLLTYAHTSNEDAFILAEQSAMHQMNVDIQRVGTGHQTKHTMGHVGVYFDGKPSYGPNVLLSDEGDLGHFFVSGLSSYYQMTGDLMALESVTKAADNYISLDRLNLKGFNYFDGWSFDYDRYIGWPLLALVSAYEATGDPYYLNASRLVIREALDTQCAEGAWANVQIDVCENSANRCIGIVTFQFGVLTSGIMEYYKATGDEAIPEMLVNAVDTFLDYNYDEAAKHILYVGKCEHTKSEYWGDCVAPALAAAYEFTKAGQPTADAALNAKTGEVLIRLSTHRMALNSSGSNGKALGMLLRFDPYAMKAADEFYAIYDSAPVSSITVTPNTLTIGMNENYTLTPAVLPDNALYDLITWTSSNTSVATVANGGRVSGRSAGEATITAKVGDFTATCSVTVVTPPAPDLGGKHIADLTVNPSLAGGEATQGYVSIEYLLSEGFTASAEVKNGIGDVVAGAVNTAGLWQSDASLPAGTYAVTITAVNEADAAVKEVFTATLTVQKTGSDNHDCGLSNENWVKHNDPLIFGNVYSDYPIGGATTAGRAQIYSQFVNGINVSRVGAFAQSEAINTLTNEPVVVYRDQWSNPFWLFSIERFSPKGSGTGIYDLTQVAKLGGITETYAATLEIEDSSTSSTNAYQADLSNVSYKTEYADLFVQQPSHTYDNDTSFVISFETLPVATGTSIRDKANHEVITYRTKAHITPEYSVALNGVPVETSRIVFQQSNDGIGSITVTLAQPLTDGDALEYTLTPGETFNPVAINGSYVHLLNEIELTGYTPLTDVMLSTDAHMITLADLIAARRLPSSVLMTDGTNTVPVAITGWTGAFDGTATGTYTLTAVWAIPEGYKDVVDPITVTINVSVLTEQTDARTEIVGYTPLADVNLTSDERIASMYWIKYSGKLPAAVEVTDGVKTANAEITGWTGTFDGTVPGAHTLTALWAMPGEFKDEVDPVTVTITVNVIEPQTDPDPVLFSGEKVRPFGTAGRGRVLATTGKNVYTTAIATDSDGNELRENQDAFNNNVSYTMDWRTPNNPQPLGDYDFTVTALYGGITEIYTGIVSFSGTSGAYDTTLSNGRYQTEYAELFVEKPSYHYDGNNSFVISFTTLPVAQGTTVSTNPSIGVWFDYRSLAQITPAYQVLLNGVPVAGDCQIDGATGAGTITVTLDAPLSQGDTVEYTLTPGNTFAPKAERGEYVHLPIYEIELEDYTPLAAIVLDADEHIMTMEELLSSGKLPTMVELIGGNTAVPVAITGWEGTFDGTATGLYTLAADWALPEGYRNEVNPFLVSVTVDVSVAQTSGLWEETPGLTYSAGTVIEYDGILWYTPTGAQAIEQYRPGAPGTSAVWAPAERPKSMGPQLWLCAEHLPEAGYERVSPGDGQTYRNRIALPNSTNQYDPKDAPALWEVVQS